MSKRKPVVFIGAAIHAHQLREIFAQQAFDDFELIEQEPDMPVYHLGNIMMDYDPADVVLPDKTGCACRWPCHCKDRMSGRLTP